MERSQSFNSVPPIAAKTSGKFVFLGPCVVFVSSEKALHVFLSFTELHGPVYLQDQSRPSSRAEKKIKEKEEANKNQEQNTPVRNEEEERRTRIKEKEEHRKKEEK